MALDELYILMVLYIIIFDPTPSNVWTSQLKIYLWQHVPTDFSMCFVSTGHFDLAGLNVLYLAYNDSKMYTLYIYTCNGHKNCTYTPKYLLPITV